MKRTITLEEEQWELLKDVLDTVELTKIEQLVELHLTDFETFVSIFRAIHNVKESKQATICYTY
jgi:hypothetical protein